MNLQKQILDNKEEYYQLAIEYYYNIDEEHLKNIDKIVFKSIVILIDHEFVPTPCIEIKIELYHQNESDRISSYCLYIDKEKEFIYEFLIDK
ncbi:hypothetical protein [Flavobacterium sp. WV_118_3]|uniref:hypothetical protein n=1 Tax=Flavobacterium sp. WV_118_3 TaxID=3151764 RepID=UPI00321A646C